MMDVDSYQHNINFTTITILPQIQQNQYTQHNNKQQYNNYRRIIYQQIITHINWIRLIQRISS